MIPKFDSDEIRKSIGKKIKMLREKAEMTQVDLAKKIGMKSTGAISQIENGERGIKLHAIIRAANVLDVHPIILLSMNEFSSTEMDILVDLMKFFKKRKNDPANMQKHFDAIKMVIEN